MSVKLFAGIQRQNRRIYQKNMCYNKYRKIIACSALTEGYEKYYRLAYSYVHNEADALDIVQEAAYKAILKSDSLKESQYVETWVYRIVINEACSFLRSRKESVDVEEIQAASEDIYENIDLKRAIENLDPKDRAIVVLRFFEDRQLEEIAKILDENLSTVKSRLYRVMKKQSVGKVVGFCPDIIYRQDIRQIQTKRYRKI